MSPEELDKARGEEAWRVWNDTRPNENGALPVPATIAARLAREGWTPPEPVDWDVLAFREWASKKWPLGSGAALSGHMDTSPYAEAYRAGQAASAERIKALEEGLKDSVTAMRLLLDAVQKHNTESTTFLSGFPLHLLSIEIAAARALLKEADQ